MKIMILLLPLFVTTGCAARANMGQPFDEATHAAVDPGVARVIVIPGVQRASRYHWITVDDGKRRKLVQGGFLALDLTPGLHFVRAKQQTTDDTYETFVSFGQATFMQNRSENQMHISVGPGEVVYLAVHTGFGTYRYECGSRGEEARICTRRAAMPQFDRIDPGDAVRRLEDLKEIEK